MSDLELAPVSLPELPTELDPDTVFIATKMLSHLAGIQTDAARRNLKRYFRDGGTVSQLLGTPIYVQLRDEMIADGMPKCRLPRWPMRDWQ